MDLAQQLQILIDQAPQDGVTPQVIATAVNPVLQRFAQELQHREYFTFQSQQGEWLITTLSNRKDPTLEKRVIYAFSTLEDAQQSQQNAADDQLRLQLIPVTHILFQLFALKQLDSLVFMETPGNLSNGTEVHRHTLQGAIQSRLKQYQQDKRSQSRLA